ncbi:hypothetical protein [Pseudomonas putida]|uniref:RiboL-PSP-HEPN domain-containing protein n=1 Tax=Pseudomonas putida TaxID=303 RepID=A0A6I6XYK6_PSEPU|nr:hypothetical protein [Pseudomonas putida]QHG64313.2 hypothetical protein C2H86_07745 [Pseudomonas putida]
MVFNLAPGQHENSVRYSLLEAIKFMAAFIDQQNEQARLFCENFDQESLRGHGFTYDDDRDELLVSGISGFEYDLDGVFKEEFPSYVVESQVIMLWAMLERNLDAVARELYVIKGLEWPELKRGKSIFPQYVERIEKVDGQPFSKSTIEFLNANVREVRNALVHGGLREVSIQHEDLDIKNGILRGVSPAYVSEVIGAMRYLAMELVAEHR